MAHRRKEFCLCACRAFCAFSRLSLHRIEASIVHCNCRPACDSVDETLFAFGENTNLLMTEKQSTNHFATSRLHRNSEITMNWQMSRRHSMVRPHLSVARILRYVVTANDALAAK